MKNLYRTLVFEKNDPSQYAITYFVANKDDVVHNSYIQTFKKMDAKYPEWSHRIERIINPTYFVFRVNLPKPEYRSRYPHYHQSKKIKSATVLMVVYDKILNLQEATDLGIEKLSKLVGHGKNQKPSDIDKMFWGVFPIGYLESSYGNYPLELDNYIII